MHRLSVVFIVTTIVLLSACAGSKISTLPVSSTVSHPINAIALAPEGGLLAEAVGIELSNRGYTIIDAATTSRMLVRLNMDEI